MNSTYEWLFANYAHELEGEFAEFEEEAVKRLERIAPLSDSQRLKVVDFLADHRFRCGVESFALGVQFALRLTEDFWAELPDTLLFPDLHPD